MKNMFNERRKVTDALRKAEFLLCFTGVLYTPPCVDIAERSNTMRYDNISTREGSV